MFRVFKRSCTDWRSFASARKVTHCFVSTEQEARDVCDRYNDNRTARQIRRGTKLEYTRES